jgi:hypothetical protein
VVAIKQVEVGQRYRIVKASGGPALTVREVVEVYVPWPGGFEHARLKCFDSSAGTMTLTSSVVADKARFLPEG